jgi:hypothetical protein
VERPATERRAFRTRASRRRYGATFAQSAWAVIVYEPLLLVLATTCHALFAVLGPELTTTRTLLFEVDPVPRYPPPTTRFVGGHVAVTVTKTLSSTVVTADETFS